MSKKRGKIGAISAALAKVNIELSEASRLESQGIVDKSNEEIAWKKNHPIQNFFKKVGKTILKWVGKVMHCLGLGLHEILESVGSADLADDVSDALGHGVDDIMKLGVKLINDLIQEACKLVNLQMSDEALAGIEMTVDIVAQLAIYSAAPQLLITKDLAALFSTDGNIMDFGGSAATNAADVIKEQFPDNPTIQKNIEIAGMAISIAIDLAATIAITVVTGGAGAVGVASDVEKVVETTEKIANATEKGLKLAEEVEEGATLLEEVTEGAESASKIGETAGKMAEEGFESIGKTAAEEGEFISEEMGSIAEEGSTIGEEEAESLEKEAETAVKSARKKQSKLIEEELNEFKAEASKASSIKGKIKAVVKFLLRAGRELFKVAQKIFSKKTLKSLFNKFLMFHGVASGVTGIVEGYEEISLSKIHRDIADIRLKKAGTDANLSLISNTIDSSSQVAARYDTIIHGLYSSMQAVTQQIRQFMSSEEQSARSLLR